MLSPEEARRLDGLTFAAAMAVPSAEPSGLRLARVRGVGGDLDDYRHYQPGDDPRLIDWTIYGRLGQLFTRTARAHARLRVHLLLDVSRSMTVGVPDKLTCARKVAATLCYVASQTRDAVGLATFDEGLVRRLEPALGRSHLLRTFAALGEATSGGRSRSPGTPSRRSSPIGQSLVDYGSVTAGPGLVVVISDFFDADVFQGLRYLRHRGLTPAVAQVVAPSDLDPPEDDVAELIDIESPEAPALLVDSGSAALYRLRMAEHRDALGEYCATHGLPWLQFVSSDPFDRILATCHRAGLLAGRG